MSMEKTPLERIRNYIKYLPAKDKSYAEAFIFNREFEQLKELVDSAIIKTKKGKKEGKIKYESIDLDSLNILKIEVDNYLLCIFGKQEESFEIEEEDDYEEDNFY